MQVAPTVPNPVRLAQVRLLVLGSWHVADTEGGPVVAGGLEMESCPPNLIEMQRRLSARRLAWILVGDVADEERAAEVVACARAVRPDLKLAALGQPADPHRCARWMRRGCLVYLAADSTIRRVAMALTCATNYGVQVVDEAFCVASGKAPRTAQAETRPLLTPRQREVLGLLSGGLSNREIGSVLNLSENTIEFHVRHLLSKFQARNRMQVARIGSEVGLCWP
jgi:DNA-binding NarL/FixJ family response regulator